VESLVLVFEAAFHKIWVSEGERRINVAPLNVKVYLFLCCCLVLLLAQVYEVDLLRSLGEVVLHCFRLIFRRRRFLWMPLCLQFVALRFAG
jgi:hypothetical protein